MRPALAIVLLALAATARSESFDDSADSIAMDAEETFSLTIEDGSVPLATGPGFRWFARVTAGGFHISDSWQYEPESPPISVNQSNVADFGDLHRFDSRVFQAGHEDALGLNSIEVLGQHIWGSDAELLNERPALRLRAEMGGVGFDVGRCPVAERSPLLASADDANERWWQGFHHANYLAYGIRYNRGLDDFNFDGSSDILGSIYSHTGVDLHLAGPQLTIGRAISKQRWMFDVSGSLLVGYARADFKQNNGIGDNVVPGGVNNLLFSQPVYSYHEDREENFGALAEIRIGTSYLIRKNWTLDLIGRAFVTGPWYQADQVVQYHLPDFGLSEPHSEYLAGANLMLGVTYLR